MKKLGSGIRRSVAALTLPLIALLAVLGVVAVVALIAGAAALNEPFSS